MREIKFRRYTDSLGMEQIDVLALTLCNWSSEGGIGVNLAYQPSIQVMQYTGLKDKNGKDIYEGDIVKYQHYTGEVHFENAGFITKSKGHFDYAMSPRAYTSEEDYEVIGNIYENPELLK